MKSGPMITVKISALVILLFLAALTMACEDGTAPTELIGSDPTTPTSEPTAAPTKAIAHPRGR